MLINEEIHRRVKLSKICIKTSQKSAFSRENYSVSQLKLLSEDCAYANTDKMVRDQIVFGPASVTIRKKLINEGKDLTFDKAIEIGESLEYY